MRDWEQYVRSHLPLQDLTQGRRSRIERELASQLEDFYREAIARGMPEPEADAHACAQIADWTRLADTLTTVNRSHARRPIDRAVDHAYAKQGGWRVVADLGCYWTVHNEPPQGSIKTV